MFSCMGASVIHWILTWTAGSLNCICDLSACVYTCSNLSFIWSHFPPYTHVVTWAYGLIFLPRTFVESAPDFESRVISGQVQNLACHSYLSTYNARLCLTWLLRVSAVRGSVLMTPPVSIGCQINTQPKPACPVVCLIYCRRVGGSVSSDGS